MQTASAAMKIARFLYDLLPRTSWNGQRKLAFANSLGCVAQCFTNILAFQIRIGAQYLRLRHAIRDHADDRRHWNAQAMNAWHAAHLIGIHGYAFKSQLNLRSGRGVSTTNS